MALKPHVFVLLMDAFGEEGFKVINDGVETVSDTTIHDDDDEIVAMIKELLETRIRPAVQEVLAVDYQHSPLIYCSSVCLLRYIRMVEIFSMLGSMQVLEWSEFSLRGVVLAVLLLPSLSKMELKTW